MGSKKSQDKPASLADALKASLKKDGFTPDQPFALQDVMVDGALPEGVMALLVSPVNLTMLMSVGQYALDNWIGFCEQVVKAHDEMGRTIGDMDWDGMRDELKTAVKRMVTIYEAHQEREATRSIDEALDSSRAVASGLLRLVARESARSGKKFDICCHFQNKNGGIEILDDPRAIADALDSDEWELVTSH
jgi:hypothetical protein